MIAADVLELVLKHWKTAAIALLIGGAIAWGARVNHLRGYYRDLLERTVVVLVDAGFDKPKLANVPTDVKLLDAQRRQYHAERQTALGKIEQQNASITNLEAAGRADRARAEANLKLYRETARQRDAWISTAQSAATRTERLSAEQEASECERVMDALYQDGF